MTSGDDVRVVEDFTADLDKLIHDIHQLTFNGVEAVPIDKSLEGLLDATKILAALPEKKMLIYFVPLALRESLGQQQLQSLIEAAKRANLAFYPIDIMSSVYH